MDLKLKYKKETGKEVRSSPPGFFPSGIYSNDYVKWLEEQLFIHSVVVNEAVELFKPCGQGENICRCKSEKDCGYNSEVALIEPLRNFIRSKHLSSEWDDFLKNYERN